MSTFTIVVANGLHEAATTYRVEATDTDAAEKQIEDHLCHKNDFIAAIFEGVPKLATEDFNEEDYR